MANEFVARNGVIALDDSQITGSLIVTNGVTGSLFGTSSFAINALTASYADNVPATASFATTASYAISASQAINSDNALTASYVQTAQTASYVLNAVSASYALSASQATSANNALTASYVILAQTASYVQTAQTASYVLNAVSASYALSASQATSANNATTASYVLNAISASFASNANNATTASYVLNAISASYATQALSASFASNADNATTASYVQTAQTASYVLNAVSASFAISSSQASTASVATTIAAVNNTGDAIRYLVWAATGAGNRAPNITTTKFVVNSATGSMGINKNTIASGYSLDVAGNTLISGSLLVTGSITAQTLIVQTVSSSVVYSSGSNIFGNQLSNTQTFTGSVNITGSLTANGPTTVVGSFDVLSGEIKAGRIDTTNEGGKVSFGRASDNLTGWYIDVYGNTSTPSLRFVDVSNASVRMTIDGSGNTQMVGSLAVGSISPSAVAGRIDASNDVVAFSTSDKRLKENIQPIENALDKLDKIGGYTFDWNDQVEIHGYEGHDVGVIAQEIESILPEVVTTRDNGYKAVKYEKIVPFLIQCIKELKDEIRDLKSQK